MRKTLEHANLNDYGRSLSVTELETLYSDTIEELHRFSLIAPSGSVDDKETDKAEAALLDLEEHLLSQASQVPLRNQNDISVLMDIWAKSSTSKDECDDQSEKIVKNIFRHLSL